MLPSFSPSPSLTAAARADDIKILTNHLGYEPDAPKHAVFLAHDGDDITAFRLLSYPDNTEVLAGHPEKVGPCDQWKNWIFWTADASPLHTEGTYTLEVTTNHGGGGTIRSFPFLIQSDLLERNTLSNVIYYFKGQRAPPASSTRPTTTSNSTADPPRPTSTAAGTTPPATTANTSPISPSPPSSTPSKSP